MARAIPSAVVAGSRNLRRSSSGVRAIFMGAEASVSARGPSLAAVALSMAAGALHSGLKQREPRQFWTGCVRSAISIGAEICGGRRISLRFERAQARTSVDDPGQDQDVPYLCLCPEQIVISEIRRGCSSMAEQKLPKLTTGVRFPSPAPPSRTASIKTTPRAPGGDCACTGPGKGGPTPAACPTRPNIKPLIFNGLMIYISRSVY